jgi:hypothetical protein
MEFVKQLIQNVKALILNQVNVLNVSQISIFLMEIAVQMDNS